MSASPALSFRLLSVPVEVECPQEESAELLLLCYERAGAVRRPAPSGALRARLLPCGSKDRDSFRIEVDGRTPRTVEGQAMGLRTFHHELLHGVMLRRSDLLYVHAAVVALEGRAIVLPARSQSGKSTLALALILKGAKLLSDELLAFDRKDLSCLCYPRALKIRDVCVPYFPDLAGRFVGQGEARYLPFSALADDVVSDRAPVALIAVPRWSEAGDPGFSPLPRRSALLELLSSTLNFGTHREESLDFLSSIIEHATSCRVIWRDPNEAATQILNALEDRASV